MAKIIELILTFERVGVGTEREPIRLKPQLWTKDGHLIAENDPVQDSKGFFHDIYLSDLTPR